MKQPSVDILLAAYANGIFPMAHPEEGGQVYWYAPDPRALLPIEDFHCPSRLARTVDQEPFDIWVDRDFEAVIRGCADRDHTWISEGLIEAYTRLHRAGFAHSVEAWDDDGLVGGLYGVAVGGLFAGESMFYRKTDASKVCLVHLADRLDDKNYELFDVQFMNDHLAQFGAYEISKAEYERRLEVAMSMERDFTG